MKKEKTSIQVHERKVPTIQELYDNTDLAITRDNLNVFLNQDPPKSWLKKNPYANNSLYLPIDKVEWMLTRFFKEWRVEVLREGTMFNTVYVVVRLFYKDPITGVELWQDGVGAKEVQTKKGAPASDLSAIVSGAIERGLPNAETNAQKDAAHKIGRVFGADLNRKDVIPFSADEKLHDVKRQKETDRLKELINRADDKDSLRELKEHIQLQDDDELLNKYYSKLLTFGTFRGEYKEEAVYYDLDYVTHNRSMFIANNPNEEPLSFEITNSEFWEEAPFYDHEGDKND